MYAKTLVRSTAAVLVALCFAASAVASDDDANDAKIAKQDVQQVNDRFYQALNDMFTGQIAPMEDVWSHGDDITCLGPAGGITVGWEAIRANWEAEAALKLGGHIEPSDLQITVGNDLAIVQCYEQGNNEPKAGEKLPVAIRATNVFRKENGQWRMISHHTDLLPFLQEQVRTHNVE